MGDTKLKHIALFLIFITFFMFHGNILLAQIDIGPPGSEDVESARKSFGEKIGYIFEKIKKAGKSASQFIPFFRNTSDKIGSSWHSGARPWFQLQWNNFKGYMNKEIRLE